MYRIQESIFVAGHRGMVGSAIVRRLQELGRDRILTALARVVGYEGQFDFDASKPDGTPRKLMDVSRLVAMGWRPQISLEAGLRQTYQWVLSKRKIFRAVKIQESEIS